MKNYIELQPDGYDGRFFFDESVRRALDGYYNEVVKYNTIKKNRDTVLILAFGEFGKRTMKDIIVRLGGKMPRQVKVIMVDDYATNMNRIEDMLDRTRQIVCFGGLGGNVLHRKLPFLLDVFQKVNVPVMGMFTLPFEHEKERLAMAGRDWLELRGKMNLMICISNSVLFQNASVSPFFNGFGAVADSPQKAFFHLLREENFFILS